MGAHTNILSRGPEFLATALSVCSVNGQSRGVLWGDNPSERCRRSVEGKQCWPEEGPIQGSQLHRERSERARFILNMNRLEEQITSSDFNQGDKVSEELWIINMSCTIYQGTVTKLYEGRNPRLWSM